jgi:YD repeat-containing protein
MANEKTASHRESSGLRGPVQTCTEETLYHATPFSPESSAKSSTEYDPPGNEVRKRHWGQDGSESETIRVYDNAGRCVKFEWRSANDKNTQTYTYDDAGRLTRETFSSSVSGPGRTKSLEYSYDASGKLVAIVNTLALGEGSQYSYDPQGRMSILQTFDPEYLRSLRRTGFDFSPLVAAQLGHGVPEGGSVATLHDEHQRPTEVQIRDANGEVVSRSTRVYHANGNPLEEKTVMERVDLLFPPEVFAKLAEQGVSREQFRQQMQETTGALLRGQEGESVFYHARYSYDEAGRLIETHRRLGPLHERIEIIRYNEQGDRAEELSTTRGAPDAELDEDGRPVPATQPVPPPEYFESRYAYQYDAHQNWIEQTVSSRSNPADPFHPSATRRRQISYY